MEWMVWQSIQIGDEVVWTIRSDYSDEFLVLDIFPHHRLKDDANEPIKVAKLKPVNATRFAQKMLEDSDASNSGDISVEVPLAALLPVIHRQVH